MLSDSQFMFYELRDRERYCKGPMCHSLDLIFFYDALTGIQHHVMLFKNKNLHEFFFSICDISVSRAFSCVYHPIACNIHMLRSKIIGWSIFKTKMP